nr:MAG TPA: hypothetical protein [Caudoviricetes sp.]
MKNERNTTSHQELFCQRMAGWLFSCLTQTPQESLF